MSLLAFKLVAALAVFLCGLGAGLLPSRLSAGDGGHRVFGLANALAAGVFLGAAVIHMFPDGLEALDGVGFEYPLVGLLAGIGFLLVLALEHGVMTGREETDVVETASDSLTAYVLLLVLSVHSVIAGATLGLETTAVASAAIVVAILAHKGSAAFALGVSLAKADLPRPRALRLLILFAASTPAGILLGTYLGAQLQGHHAALLEGAFDGLAAGTFLYVAILDLLAEEFEQPESRWAKISLVAVGMGIMGVVAIWA